MNQPNTRHATTRILEMVDEGILDRDTVIMSCLKYMSEDDVADMAHANELFPYEDEDEDEDDETDEDEDEATDLEVQP
jgi:hypothetical protein